MGQPVQNLIKFINGGIDSDSAPEEVVPNDYLYASNFRSTGTQGQKAGYLTSVESTELVSSVSPPSGIIKGIGGKEFEDIKKAVTFRYNSFGYNQILLYDYAADTHLPIYTDLTDSDGIALLPLDPSFYVNYILLVNQQYLVWTDGNSSIGFTDLNKLTSGAYGTILAEDFSLIKPQPMAPIIGEYASDPGKASNFLKSKLYQFNALYVGEDFTYSAWSTWSKRIVPSEESTPTVGTDVRVNNCIVLQVPVGSIRVKTINVGARFGDFGFSIIKSVDRAYVIALPDTEVDITTEVYEAYNPATGIYSFVFYNDTISVPVAPTDTDLAYDRVARKAGALELINGNIIAVGDLTEGYERPTTAVNITVAGYDPNIDVPVSSEPNPITVDSYNSGAGSGLGNHVRLMRLYYKGVPHTGDVLKVQLYNVSTGQQTNYYSFTVSAPYDGLLEDTVRAFGQQFQQPAVYFDGTYWIIEFRGDPYEEIQSAAVSLNNTGATVSKSIHALLDNSSYQLALSYRDTYGRYFPLRTGNEFMVKTLSYAQILGTTNRISWTLPTATAPDGAVDYQWLITKNNSALTLLDVLGNIIDYKGTWDANANTPSLIVNIGTVGDCYLISVPSQPDDHRNLGNGEVQFNTGDYVVYNGSTWDIIDKSFADFSSNESVMAFKINPLSLFNQTYSDAGLDTVLTYDFAKGDRCTLHYSLTAGTKSFFNNPCIELQVLGYDPATFIVKVERSAVLDPDTISGKDIFLRLYSPKESDQTASTAQNATVWYEIGERFTITDGLHDTLTGNITDGDVYYKTRVYKGAVDPNVLVGVLATDFNFSDFYASAFTSYGRPRAYDDELELSQRKAIIRYSQNYILGSKNNGLTRFFAEAIYGQSDGQTSSNYGGIQALWQRGDILVVLQETNHGYIPINLSVLEDAIQQKQYAISQRLFNNIRYNQTGNIGCGTAKESFCLDEKTGRGWFVDPNISVPYEITVGGVIDISSKMSKFFKDTIQLAYASGKKLVMYYDRYYKEVVFATEVDGSMLTLFSFNALSWQVLDDYTIAPADITANNGANSTVAYNTGTGVAVYTPTTDYVGNDVATISFNPGTGVITKNVCLNWTAGTTSVVQFTFVDVTGATLSTVYVSNAVLVSGNNIAVPISIVNGEYRVNGGSWTSAAGTVNQYDSVEVRRTSSGSNATTVGTTLTISDKSDTFDITTISTLAWRVKSGTEICAVEADSNTGYQFYKILEEYNTTTNVATGKIQPNIADSVLAAQVIPPNVVTYNYPDDVAPTGGIDGDVIYNPVVNELFIKTGGSWLEEIERDPNDEYVAPVLNTGACPVTYSLTISNETGKPLLVYNNVTNDYYGSISFGGSAIIEFYPRFMIGEPLTDVPCYGYDGAGSLLYTETHSYTEGQFTLPFPPSGGGIQIGGTYTPPV